MDQFVAIVVRGLIGVVSILPARFALSLGGSVGSLYARIGAPRVSDARINLDLAFPEWSPETKRRVQIESFANLGRSFAELCGMQGRHRERIFDAVAIEGSKNLDEARGRSRTGGVLVLTAHFGSWEMCAAALSQKGIPISVVYRGFDNPHLEQIVIRWRESAGIENLRMNGGAALGIFRALERGQCVALLMDQNAGSEEGTFAPFFSRAACTRSAPLRLAMDRGIPIVPVFFHRVAGTRHHIARIEKMLDLEGDSAADENALIENVSRVNACVERAIRGSPAQWLWSHRRWRTRPAEDPRSLYPSRRSKKRKKEKSDSSDRGD